MNLKNNEKNIKKFNNKIKLSNILNQSNIFLLHNINNKKQLLNKLSSIVENLNNISNKEIFSLLSKKENIENTGIGSGIALPNIKLENIKQSIGIFLKLNKPINYNSIDNEPVDIIFFLISPTNDVPIHLNELAHISRFLTKKKTLQNIRAALDKETIYAIITNEL
ncbi:MAG: hypothetical protein CMJ12_01980 [Pelagibacterales bacterium]|nr:hypothetical protein [Pelagibacterales bacterium]PPR16710.1 MAG: Nitrogen regulatory protein [Alphaproteobacteria bacterium MarineAlpha9_Bin3]|tara:strand:+ start:8166 stop:8663 length:498 start_codon:yes stop_codon:yes gene_type:complete